jgi:hypothetical protein
MKVRNLLIVFLLLTPAAVSANDGYGGLTATGLQFGKSKTVRMVSEDLFLSPKQVRVRCARNDEQSLNRPDQDLRLLIVTELEGE